MPDTKTVTVRNEKTGQEIDVDYDAAKGPPSPDEVDELFAHIAASKPSNPFAPTNTNATRLFGPPAPGSPKSQTTANFIPPKVGAPAPASKLDALTGANKLESNLQAIQARRATMSPAELAQERRLAAESTGNGSESVYSTPKFIEHEALDTTGIAPRIVTNYGLPSWIPNILGEDQSMATARVVPPTDSRGANLPTKAQQDAIMWQLALSLGGAGIGGGAAGALASKGLPIAAQVAGFGAPIATQIAGSDAQTAAQQRAEAEARAKFPAVTGLATNAAGLSVNPEGLAESAGRRLASAGIMGGTQAALGFVNRAAVDQPQTLNDFINDAATGAAFGLLGGHGEGEPVGTTESKARFNYENLPGAESGRKYTAAELEQLSPERFAEVKNAYLDKVVSRVDLDAWNAPHVDRPDGVKVPPVTADVLKEYFSHLPADATPYDRPTFWKVGKNPQTGETVNIYKTARRADGHFIVAYGEENLPSGATNDVQTQFQTPAQPAPVAASEVAKPAAVPVVPPTTPETSAAPVSAQPDATQTQLPEYAQKLKDAGYSPITDFDSLRSTIKQAAPHLSDEAAHNTALLVESLRRGSSEQLGTNPDEWYEKNLPTIIRGTQEKAQQVADQFNDRLRAKGKKADAEAGQFGGVTDKPPVDYPLSSDDALKVVTLFPAADESTAPHEIAGHIFVNMLEREAGNNNAVATRDLAAIKAWAGVNTVKEAQEPFAVAYEKWLKDGVAPNEFLKGTFARFSGWLKNIYESTATVFGGKKEKYDLLGENKPFDDVIQEMVSRYHADAGDAIGKEGVPNATPIQSDNTGRGAVHVQPAGGRLTGEAGGDNLPGNTGTVGNGRASRSGEGTAGGRIVPRPNAGESTNGTGTGAERPVDPANPYEIEPGDDDPLYQWHKGLRTPWSSEKFGEAKLDSAFEAVRAAMLDEDPNVKSVERNFAKIPYESPLDGKMHNYFPDFLVTTKDGRKFVEEVKPLDRVTDAVVKAKAEAAQQYYGDKNISYHFVTENDLPAKRIADARTAIKAGAAQKEDGSANFQRRVNGKPAPTAPPEKPTLAQNLTSLYKAGLLSNPPTHIKNMTGNAGMQMTEELARIPASMADIVRVGAAHAANKAGKTDLGDILGTNRTTAGLDLAAVAKASREAATTGIREAYELIKTGQVKNDRFAPPIDLGKDLGVNKEFATRNWILNGAVNTIFRGLSAQDRLFKTYSWRRSIEAQASLIAQGEAQAAKEAGTALSGDQIKARRKELSEQPTNAMTVQALEDAEVSTFNSNNWISDQFKKIRRSAANPDPVTGKARNPFRAMTLDTLLPFTGTPVNVVNRTLEYTLGTLIAPARAGWQIHQDNAAIAKGIADRTFDDAAKRDFATTFGRGVTGASMIALGYALAGSGQLTGTDTGSGDRQKRDKTGIPPGSMKVGNKWLRIDFAAPGGTLLVMGATLREQMAKGNDEKSGINAIGAAGSLAANGIPLVEGVPIIQAAKTGDWSQAIGQQAASGIPSIVKSAAQAIDHGKARDTSKHTLDPVVNSIPFLRGTLPEKKTHGKPPPRRNPLDAFNVTDGGKSDPNIFRGNPFRKR